MSTGNQSPFPPQRDNNALSLVEILRSRGPLVGTLIVVAALVIGFVMFSSVYSEVLWFDQLGFVEIFFKQYGTGIALFLAAFLIMALVVSVSLRLAYRHRPVLAADAQLSDNLARYQAQLEPIRKVLLIAIPVVLGIFAGTAMFSQWQTVLLFLFQEPFGQTDPQFGLDLSFFINTLPFLIMLVGFLTSVVALAGIGGLLTHYVYGGIRIEEPRLFISRAARIHVVVFGALFLLLQAASWWLDRYHTLLTERDKWTGAMYTDVNAVIPTKAILAVAAIVVVVLLILTAVTARWRFSIIGVAMLLVTMLVASGAYPFLVQRFQVTPTEEGLERQYIQRNIDMTRQAYGLSEIDVQQYSARTDAKAGALRQDAATAANIRLMDPNIIGPAFNQLQQFRDYYGFPRNLSVDRYTIDGKSTDTVISVRELNVDGTPNNWVNRVINYTHGYGVVAAAGSRVQTDGKPVFLQSGLPSNGFLGNDGDFEPRIYFGASSPAYSIVGAPEGADPQEIDRPAEVLKSDDTTPTDTGEDPSGEPSAEPTQEQENQGGSGNVSRYTFEGNGGPDIGNFFNRLVYSIKFQSTDLLLSNNVNEKSQILYERDPRERIQKVAPYLTVDSKMYPAVIDGRIKWIVDAYTTSSNYPYSTPTQLDEATRDTINRDPRNPQLAKKVNYVRNAVKATVDAYDGSVDLYAWDTEDPIIKAWQKVFPQAMKPYTEMSSELMSHVRYPEDQFKVQRELLGRYHVTDAGAFYQDNDAWMTPDDPVAARTDPNAQQPNQNTQMDTSNTGVKQPPYYLTLQMPGQDKPAFSLTSAFIPFSTQADSSRNLLYGFLAADGDAGNEEGKKADSYGKLRLLELPRTNSIPGPGQAQNRFNSEPTVSQALNLLRQGASRVINGNLLTLPMGGGMLYVQPVYVQSSGESSYPTLQRVLVSFGDKVGFADTLDEALDQLFSGDSGITATDADNKDKGDGRTPPTTTGQTPEQELKSALERANAAIKESEEALAKQDFAAYGEAQKKLNQAIQDAISAEEKIDQG